jgi:hypothetical protein
VLYQLVDGECAFLSAAVPVAPLKDASGRQSILRLLKCFRSAEGTSVNLSTNFMIAATMLKLDLTHGLFFGVHVSMFLLLTSSTVSTPAFSPPSPFKKVLFEHLIILRNLLLWSMTVLEDAVGHASSVCIELTILRMATSTSSLSPHRNRDGMPRIDSFGL